MFNIQPTLRMKGFFRRIVRSLCADGIYHNLHGRFLKRYYVMFVTTKYIFLSELVRLIFRHNIKKDIKRLFFRRQHKIYVVA